MMRLSIDEVFRGIVGSVEEYILPELRSPFGQAQAKAIVGILRNLDGRIEESCSILARENESYRRLFRRVHRVLVKARSKPRRGKLVNLDQALVRLLKTKRASNHQQLRKQNRQLRVILGRSLITLETVEAQRILGRQRIQLREDINRFLRKEVEKEARLLQPLRWKEIASATNQEGGRLLSAQVGYRGCHTRKGKKDYH